MSEPAAKKTKNAPIRVMVNGLPGNMGQVVSNACIRRGFLVANIAFTGPNMPETVEVGEEEKTTVTLLGPDADGLAEKVKELAAACAAAGETLVAIDFTHPSAVNKNAKLYCDLQVPFVMGTTGGNREELMADAKKSGVFAVIAPNMCKQIVALQAMMKTMATEYPGAFSGYSLEVVESHQNGKADTSGTAKALVEYFNELRGDTSTFGVDNIQKIRDPEKQKEFGVPEDALLGHAWHTYTMKSGDGSVVFEFKHNVCGRTTYAEGVADAVAFLASKIQAGEEKKLYDMIDVLRAGAMQ